MFKYISVFIGGGLGANLRYLISLLAANYGASYQGTFIINMTGCLFIGFVSYLALEKSDSFDSNLKLFLITGIAGGFTTFSTFSYEAFMLIKDGQILTSLIYILLSGVIGIFATALGMFLAKIITSINLTVEPFQQIND